MRAFMRATGIGVALLTAAVTFSVTHSANAAPSPTGAEHRAVKVCPAAPGLASCHAWVRTDVAPFASSPGGLNPPDLRSAYNLTSAGSSTQTIAIVDAFDDPAAEQDLAVYRSQFGLPACTTANGCFRKVDQNGGTTYPRKDAGWALEISLDLDMASAICPNCHLLLVEATTNSLANLGAAVNRAATMGANVISNSYGGSDLADSSAPFYNHPGIAITASSGDSGFGNSFPASSHFVTSVGGTTLRRASGTSRGWSETVWSGAGSGCSSLNAAITGQSNVNTGCSTRAFADVSAVADPNTGVSVYDTQRFQGLSGWFVVGGTSASAPIIAGVYALAGNSASISNSTLYTSFNAANFFDVTSGSNGNCSPSQLCNARAGWDGPTGLGTPNGTGGF